MRRFLVRLSESEASNHTPSLADVTIITSELKFSLHTGSPQNVCLLPQHPSFHLERYPRPKQICDHPNNEPDKISHPARASPDSRSTASQMEFATGTRTSRSTGPGSLDELRHRYRSLSI